MIRFVDNVLRVALGPDDWLGRHPGVCLALIFVLILIEGAITHG